MERIAQHKILVTGDSFEHSCDQVSKFFDLTSLVIYDCVQVNEEQCLSGSDAVFLNELTLAVKKNHETVNSLVEELRQTGAETILDLKHLEHGYPSKILHVLSHMLDGFIGIDSYFYNLGADSHWLSEEDSKSIQENPANYWLIHIDCFSASPAEAGLLHA
ncbi:hypothetical protein [Desulfosediminicola flagellatus]|uniref:hypothetical protein n=1 Tax=Desulfosediminicola flagellatus TaxID=2569541 RepID=UPI0010AC0C4E|nr:hypothetical protein [Desulfosediminicola flagellatus]